MESKQRICESSTSSTDRCQYKDIVSMIISSVGFFCIENHAAKQRSISKLIILLWIIKQSINQIRFERVCLVYVFEIEWMCGGCVVVGVCVCLCACCRHPKIAFPIYSQPIHSQAKCIDRSAWLCINDNSAERLNGWTEPESASSPSLRPSLCVFFFYNKPGVCARVFHRIEKSFGK